MEIYFIRNTVNGKVYIGRTTVSFKTRCRNHRTLLATGTHKNRHLQSAYNQNPDAFTFELFATASNSDDLSRMEIGLIALYQANAPEYGYNKSCGGEGGGFGVTRSAETRALLSQLKTGRRKRVVTNCKLGHHFDDSNTYVTPSGARVCRECKRIRGRGYYQRQHPNVNRLYGTHCKHGHAYTCENTRVDKSGSRHCRTCNNERERRRRANRRNATLSGIRCGELVPVVK